MVVPTMVKNAIWRGEELAIRLVDIGEEQALPVVKNRPLGGGWGRVSLPHYVCA